jgi:hypothetical protein
VLGYENIFFASFLRIVQRASDHTRTAARLMGALSRSHLNNMKTEE